MILVLAEAALELVPESLWRHPAIVADARRRGKKPGEILLDRARHHVAMAKLEKAEKRGRPDIVHQVLLAFQYSLLNRAGRGRAFVHTVGDYIISVKPETRVPKNYNNFVSLMEQLFKVGRVPPEGVALMEARRGSLAALLEELGGKWVVLHEQGRAVSFAELGRALADAVVVVGGFPHGDFENKWVLEGAETVYKIGNVSLDAAQAVCRAVAAAEAELGLI